jgi:Ca2+-transporting ATPase
MAVGQLLLTYPSRHTWTRPLPNPYLHGAVVSGIAIQLGAGLIPSVSALLGNAGLPPALWLLVFAASAVSWAIAEGWARLAWHGTWPRPAGGAA